MITRRTKMKEILEGKEMMMIADKKPMTADKKKD